MRCTCYADEACAKHKICNARSQWHDLWCQLKPGHIGEHADGGSVTWERSYPRRQHKPA